MEGFSTTHSLVDRGDGNAEMAKLSLIREKTKSTLLLTYKQQYTGEFGIKFKYYTFL